MIPLTDDGDTCPLGLMLSSISLAFTNIFLPAPQFKLTEDQVVIMHSGQILCNVYPYTAQSSTVSTCIGPHESEPNIKPGPLRFLAIPYATVKNWTFFDSGRTILFPLGTYFCIYFQNWKCIFEIKVLFAHGNSARFTQLRWNVLGYRNLLQVLNGISLLPSCLARNSPRKGPQYPLTTACNHMFSVLTLLNFIMPFDTIDPSLYVKNQPSLDLRHRTSAIFSNFSLLYCLLWLWPTFSLWSFSRLSPWLFDAMLYLMWVMPFTVKASVIYVSDFQICIYNLGFFSELQTRAQWPTGHLKFNVSKQISLFILSTSMKVPSA